MKRIIILASLVCGFNVEARPLAAAAGQKSIHAHNKPAVEFPEEFLEIGKLRDRAIYKFVESANSSNSELATLISRVNTNTSDGRSPNGTIHLPIRHETLQVAVVNATNTYGWMHYAENIDGLCSGVDLRAEVNVFLPRIIPIHKEVGYDTMQFKVSVERNLSFKIPANERSCEAYWAEHDGVNMEENFTVSAPALIGEEPHE